MREMERAIGLSEVVLDVVVGVLGRGRVVELELLGVEVLNERDNEGN